MRVHADKYAAGAQSSQAKNDAIAISYTTWQMMAFGNTAWRLVRRVAHCGLFRSGDDTDGNRQYGPLAVFLD